jgi:hypothetical protein
MTPGAAMYIAMGALCVKRGIPTNDFIAILNGIVELFNVDRMEISKCMIEGIEASAKMDGDQKCRPMN